MIGSVNVPGASVADMAVINNTLSNKVDKETGKGLSSNDYTTEDKQKLASLENYDDSTLLIAIANKVDKIDGKGLSTEDYTTEEKTKLANIDLNNDTSQDIEDIKHLLYPSITAAGVQGIPVTFTKGDRVLSQVADESYTATKYIPELGTWTVATTINGVEISKDVDVAAVMEKYILNDYIKSITTDTKLSTAKYEIGAATIGGYALFAGGMRKTTIPCNDTDAISSSLVKTSVENLSYAKIYFAATSIGNYALFGGGASSTSNVTYYSNVDVYSDQLMKSTAPDLGYSCEHLSATSVGDYALFGGGSKYYVSTNYYAFSSTVTCYDTSLVRSYTSTGISVNRENIATAAIGDYALFAGGFRYNNGYNYYDTTEAWNSSLVKTTPTALSVPRASSCTATVGNYAIIAGGNSHSNNSPGTTVDIYDSSLVKSIGTSLSASRSGSSATSIGKYALFAGGGENIDVYNDSLVRTQITLTARNNMASTTVGSYALFAGGYTSISNSTYYNTISAFQYTYV